MRLTLTSLNIQGFDSWIHEPWDTRTQHIIKYFEEVQPDIACFQELVYLPDVSPYNPMQLLNQKLHYPYEASEITRLQVGRVHPVYREGIGTLSQHAIVKTDAVVLQKAEGDEHNRIVQLIDIRLENGQLLKLANVHYSLTDYTDFATPHLKETLEIIKSRGEKRIIIGDFNHVRLEDLETIWGEDYRSTSDIPYVTYPIWYEGPKHGPKRVDYALIPKEYEFVSITTSPDGLSDHRALTIVIDIPETT